MNTIAAVSDYAWIGWVIGAMGFLWGIFSWLRTRRHIAIVRFHAQTEKTDGNRHIRYFVVDVESWGVDLYDVGVFLKWKGSGTDVGSIAFDAVNAVPQPFKLGQSCRFLLGNWNPHEPTVFNDMPTNDLWVVVMSGVNELKRVSGVKFRKTFNDVIKVDKTLPAPPRQAPVTETIPWIRLPQKW